MRYIYDTGCNNIVNSIRGGDFFRENWVSTTDSHDFGTVFELAWYLKANIMPEVRNKTIFYGLAWYLIRHDI